MKKVYSIVSDTGGGHRSTARALQQLIEQQKLPWEVHIVEFFRDIVGVNDIQESYNNVVLKKNWARIINEPILAPSLKLRIRWRYKAWLKLLQSYWQQQQPDLVVSVFPYINRLLAQSLQELSPEVPFVTLMTDFADCPPHFWIEPECPHIICPTDYAVLQAQKLGCTQEQIFATSGLTINPHFYNAISQRSAKLRLRRAASRCALNRHSERQKLGLNPDLPTGLVMCGGYGSKVMLEIAESLEQSQLDLQLIFLCGHNKELAATLERTQKLLPRLVKTFTTEVPYYMHLSDFFIGKPGPGSISEALRMKLPVITECNAYTLFQEKYNAKWIIDNEVGMVVRHFRDVDKAVTELLQEDKLSRYRAKAASFNNQGIFEVMEILQQLISHSDSDKTAIEPTKELI